MPINISPKGAAPVSVIGVCPTLVHLPFALKGSTSTPLGTRSSNNPGKKRRVSDPARGHPYYLRSGRGPNPTPTPVVSDNSPRTLLSKGLPPLELAKLPPDVRQEMWKEKMKSREVQFYAEVDEGAHPVLCPLNFIPYGLCLFPAVESLEQSLGNINLLLNPEHFSGIAFTDFQHLIWVCQRCDNVMLPYYAHLHLCQPPASGA